MYVLVSVPVSMLHAVGSEMPATPLMVWTPTFSDATAQGVAKWCRLQYPGRPIAPSCMSPNAGGERELRVLRKWIELYTGAQINFGNLTPYLTNATALQKRRRLHRAPPRAFYYFLGFPALTSHKARRSQKALSCSLRERVLHNHATGRLLSGKYSLYANIKPSPILWGQNTITRHYIF